MTQPAESTSCQREDERQLVQITDWAQTHLGGTVTAIERQRRWRPVWRMTMDNGREYLFKADRVWAAHPYPHIHEKHLLNVMADHGIPVPPQRGFCEEPPAIVMDWVKGGRDPGLVMEAAENASTMTPDRWAASLRYMEQLAAMHSIPAEAFEAIGCVRPEGPEAIALAHFERFHAMLDLPENSHIVDPLIRFTRGWLHRHVPQNRSRVSFVTGDSGQFLSEGPDLTCVLDVEIGHLGDPLHDLACYRGRHPVENMGDLPALFRHYEQALGEPLDLDAMAFHTVVFLCAAYYGPRFAMGRTDPGGDWVEAAVQCPFIGRRMLEALAEIEGVELENLELPAPRPSPVEEMGLLKLAADIRSMPLSDTFAGWQRGILATVPDFLLNQARYRRWAEDTDLNEIEALIGHRPTDMADADILLDAFVADAGPNQDHALLHLFHRKLLRQCLIIAGPDNPGHIALMKVEPLLDGRMDRVDPSLLHPAK